MTKLQILRGMAVVLVVLLATHVDAFVLDLDSTQSEVETGFRAGRFPAHGPLVSVSAHPGTQALRTGDAEGKDTRLKFYVLHVIDSGSHNPVSNAQVRVEISGSDQKIEGHTDPDGFFTFKWHISSPKELIKAHISVEAKGFLPLEDVSPLAEDRILEMTRAK